MKPALRIALLYAILSGIYILVSDGIALIVAKSDPALLTAWQSAKGLGFVAASAIIIFALVLHYVRQRDRVERRLVEAHADFERLFQRNPLPAGVYDTESLALVEVNAAAIEEYGYSRGEFLSLTLDKLIRPEDAEKLRTHIAKVKPYPYVGRWKHVRKDGSIAEVEVISHPVHFLGRPARLFVVANLTARKVAERAVAEAFSAKDRWESAHAEFLGMISHEMRTPLNAITGYLSLYEEEKDSRARAEYLHVIEENVDKLLVLIDSLINAADLSISSASLETAPVDIRAFLQEVSKEFEPYATRRKLRLSLGFDPLLPEIVIFDSTKVGEVVEILICNALKFSHEGEVTLSAKLTDSSLMISLSDKGIGISVDEHERIFGSFYQVDHGLTRKYEGVGLGLFVARKLCSLMGASLSVESAFGEGSTFILSLPGRTNADGIFECGFEIEKES